MFNKNFIQPILRTQNKPSFSRFTEAQKSSAMFYVQKQASHSHGISLI